MKMYKGYKIEKLTPHDYVVRTAAGKLVGIPDGRWSFRLQREAKAFIDALVAGEEAEV